MEVELTTGNIVMSDVSDHYSTLTKIYDFPKSNEKTEVYTRKSDLNENEWNGFNLGLHNSLTNEIPLGMNNLGVNYQAVTISTGYQTMIDKYMPRRKESSKQKKRISKPWMSPGLMNSSAKKKQLFVESKLSNDPKDTYLNTYGCTKYIF